MKSLKRKLYFSGIFVMLTFLLAGGAYSKVELTILKDLNLDAVPSDIAVSAEGDMIYILTPGKILIYETAKEALSERIPMDKEYDRMTYSEKLNALVLSSSKSKSVRIIEPEKIFEIPVSGSPMKGKKDAKVLIAVFDDYQ